MSIKYTIQIFSADLTRQINLDAKQIVGNSIKDNNRHIVYIDDLNKRVEVSTSNTIFITKNGQ